MRYPFEAAVLALAAANFLPEGDSLGNLALVGYPVFYILFVCKRYPFKEAHQPPSFFLCKF